MFGSFFEDSSDERLQAPKLIAQQIISTVEDTEGETDQLILARLALDLCSATSEILRARIADLESHGPSFAAPYNDQCDEESIVVAESSSSLKRVASDRSIRHNHVDNVSCLSDCSPEFLRHTCEYLIIVEKARLRTSARGLHRSLMGCPIDLTESHTIGDLANAQLILQTLAPLRLQVRDSEDDSHCDCSAGRAIRSIGLGSTLTLASRHHESSSSSCLFTSLGFNRSWTVYGVPLISVSSATDLPLILRSLEVPRHLTRIQIGAMSQGIIDAIGTYAHLLPSLREMSYRHEWYNAEGEELTEYDYPLLGSLSSLVHLTNLRVAHLGNTHIEGDLSSLASLVELEVLYLGNTQVTGDIVGLAGLRKLKLLILDFCVNVHGDIRHLSSLVQMERLILGNTRVHGDISAVSKLVKLEGLFLGNSLVTGDLSSLAALTSLKHLDVSVTKVGGDLGSLYNLERLESLYIEGSFVTGNAASLAPMVVLKHIDIQMPEDQPEGPWVP